MWIKRGLCSLDSLLNILLCVLGYLPGVLHAWYIIARYPDDPDYLPLGPDAEAGHDARVTYYYVSSDGHRMTPGSQQHHVIPGGQANKGYGTAGPQTPKPVNAPAPASGPAPVAQPETGEGSSSAAVPPSYDDAVKGDNKVQT